MMPDERKTCRSLFLNCKFIKKETLTQMFSCGFYDLFKNACFLKNTSGGQNCSNVALIILNNFHQLRQDLPVLNNSHSKLWGEETLNYHEEHL